MDLVRLVLTQAIFGLLLLLSSSAGRHPMKVCHRAECVGGGGMALPLERFDVSGGLDGGGEFVLLLSLLLLELPSRHNKVSDPVSGVVLGFALYSQQGNTRCPEGAISPWKHSVPGGKCLRRS